MKLKIARYGLDTQTLPEMEGWTGRDIDNCARKAEMAGVPLVEAAKYIVPLMRSNAEEMESLRASADGKYLSASKSGIYEYTKPTIKHESSVVVKEGRKMR